MGHNDREISLAYKTLRMEHRPSLLSDFPFLQGITLFDEGLKGYDTPR